MLKKKNDKPNSCPLYKNVLWKVLNALAVESSFSVAEPLYSLVQSKLLESKFLFFLVKRFCLPLILSVVTFSNMVMVFYTKEF